MRTKNVTDLIHFDDEAARTEIRRSAGTHFDPSVVKSFMDVPLGTLEEIRRRSLT